MSDGGPTGSITAEVSSDAMELRLVYAPDPNGVVVETKTCEGALGLKQIVVDQGMQVRVQSFMEQITSQPREKLSFVVAEGAPAVAGEDGRLEFQPGFDPSKKREESEAAIEKARAGAKSKAEEAVDFHERSAFILVNEGEHIADVVEPTKGTPGSSVEGRELATLEGKPFQLKTDESIDEQTGGKLVATCSGVLSFNGESLKVLTQLEVEGDVDFSIGNIDFPGDVVVHGGVKDGFKIEAEGDVHVHALVEAAEVATVGDLHMLRGASAREKGRIFVGRDLHARHLNGAHVEVARNAMVEKEIMHCEVDVWGSMVSEGCSVLGGTLHVARDCNVAVIGGDDAPTEVFVGQSAQLASVRERATSTLLKMTKELAEWKKEYDELVKKSSELIQAQIERMTELQFDISETEKRVALLRDTLAGLEKTASVCVSPTLTVQKRLRTGTKLTIWPHRAKVTTDVKGPAMIRLSKTGEAEVVDLISESTAPLSDFATVWQEELPNLGGEPDEDAPAEEGELKEAA